MSLKKIQSNKGFTLIELLVVVAILGLLATIVAVSLTGARARARDGRRASDLRQVELALELYYSAERQYPTKLGTLVDEGYLNMSESPKDPNTGDDYCYTYGKDDGYDKEKQFYHIGAVLENSDSDLLGEDKDASGELDNAKCRGTCSWYVGVEGGSSNASQCTWDSGSGSLNYTDPGRFDGDNDNSDAPTYDRAVLPQD